MVSLLIFGLKIEPLHLLQYDFYDVKFYKHYQVRDYWHYYFESLCYMLEVLMEEVKFWIWAKFLWSYWEWANG